MPRDSEERRFTEACEVRKAGSPLMESGTLSIRDVPVIRGGGVALLGSHMFP